MNRWKPLAALALLAGLTLLLVARGVLPAISKIDTDFPNYFTAARIIAAGGPAERLYDQSWFQEQIRLRMPGAPAYGSFTPFPPPTALLLLPLTSFEPLTALRITVGVSILCLFGSILLLARAIPLGLLDSAVVVLLAGYNICSDLRYGQPYIVISFACILGYYAWRTARPWLAGICLGLFVPLKYFPVILLAAFAARKQWRVVLGGVAAACTVGLIGLMVLGWKVHEVFLSSVLGNHLVGRPGVQDPFAVSFQSFDVLYRKLFVFDAARNPHPWHAAAYLQIPAVAVTKAALAVLAVATLFRVMRVRGAGGASRDLTDASLGLLAVLMLLIAPATASYHFILLWLPVGLLLGIALRERAHAHAATLLVLYALISFFPYGHFAGFAGQGALIVLAFARLWIMLGMFLCACHLLWRPARPLAVPIESPAQ